MTDIKYRIGFLTCIESDSDVSIIDYKIFKGITQQRINVWTERKGFD